MILDKVIINSLKNYHPQQNNTQLNQDPKHYHVYHTRDTPNQPHLSHGCAQVESS